MIELQASTDPGRRALELAERLADTVAADAGGHDRDGTFAFDGLEAVGASGRQRGVRERVGRDPSPDRPRGRRRSHFIYGVGDDAAYVAERIGARLRARRPRAGEHGTSDAVAERGRHLGTPPGDGSLTA